MALICGAAAEQIVGRERNQRACHRQLVRNVVVALRVNSTVRQNLLNRLLLLAVHWFDSHVSLYQETVSSLKNREQRYTFAIAKTFIVWRLL